MPATRTVLSGSMPRTVEAKQCSVTCFKCMVVDVQLGGKGVTNASPVIKLFWLLKNSVHILSKHLLLVSSKLYLNFHEVNVNNLIRTYSIIKYGLSYEWTS